MPLSFSLLLLSCSLVANIALVTCVTSAAAAPTLSHLWTANYSSGIVDAQLSSDLQAVFVLTTDSKLSRRLVSSGLLMWKATLPCDNPNGGAQQLIVFSVDSDAVLVRCFDSYTVLHQFTGYVMSQSGHFTNPWYDSPNFVQVPSTQEPRFVGATRDASKKWRLFCASTRGAVMWNVTDPLYAQFGVYSPIVSGDVIVWPEAVDPGKVFATRSKDGAIIYSVDGGEGDLLQATGSTHWLLARGIDATNVRSYDTATGALNFKTPAPSSQGVITGFSVDPSADAGTSPFLLTTSSAIALQSPVDGKFAWTSDPFSYFYADPAAPAQFVSEANVVFGYSVSGSQRNGTVVLSRSTGRVLGYINWYCTPHSVPHHGVDCMRNSRGAMAVATSSSFSLSNTIFTMTRGSDNLVRLVVVKVSAASGGVETVAMLSQPVGSAAPSLVRVAESQVLYWGGGAVGVVKFSS